MYNLGVTWTIEHWRKVLIFHMHCCERCANLRVSPEHEEICDMKKRKTMDTQYSWEMVQESIVFILLVMTTHCLIWFPFHKSCRLLEFSLCTAALSFSVAGSGQPSGCLDTVVTSFKDRAGDVKSGPGTWTALGMRADIEGCRSC